MASVRYREGRGTWEVQWKELVTTVHPDGSTSRRWVGRRRKCPDKRTAEQLRREVEAAVALGKAWTDERGAPVATVATIAEAWIKVSTLRRTRSTAGHRATLLQRFVDWFGAEQPVSALTAGVLRSYAEHLTAEGVKTAGRYVATVEQLWAWAHDNGDSYPGVPLPKRVTGADRDIQHYRSPIAVDNPSWSDVDKMIFALSRAGGEAWKRRVQAEREDGRAGGVGYHPAWEPYRRVAIVQRYTGLRISQVLNLQICDLDTTRLRVTIRAEHRGSKGQRQDRIVPMHPGLAAELAQWGVLDHDGLLLPRQNNRDKPRMLNRADVGAVFRAAWTRAEVRYSAWGAVGRTHGRPTNAIRACWKSAISGAASYDLAALMLGQASRGEHDSYVAVGNPDASPYWEAMVKALEAVPGLETLG